MGCVCVCEDVRGCGSVWGVCGVCVGCVWGVCGVCVGCVRVCGVRECVGSSEGIQKEP